MMMMINVFIICLQLFHVANTKFIISYYNVSDGIFLGVLGRLWADVCPLATDQTPGHAPAKMKIYIVKKGFRTLMAVYS